MSNNDKELKEKIEQLVLEIVRVDKELRDKYQIGDKFRFIRDRLEALRVRVEEELKTLEQEPHMLTDQLVEDEVLVFVYIFNAQGLVFHTWQKMVSASVFYEYSVNRPIYTEKSHVEAFIRSKPNKAQHGYITVALKKDDILAAGSEQAKDPAGHPLVKIKEGSLKFNKLFSFTHQENEYIVDAAGHLVRKS